MVSGKENVPQASNTSRQSKKEVVSKVKDVKEKEKGVSSVDHRPNSVTRKDEGKGEPKVVGSKKQEKTEKPKKATKATKATKAIKSEPEVNSKKPKGPTKKQEEIKPKIERKPKSTKITSQTMPEKQVPSKSPPKHQNSKKNVRTINKMPQRGSGWTNSERTTCTSSYATDLQNILPSGSDSLGAAASGSGFPEMLGHIPRPTYTTMNQPTSHFGEIPSDVNFPFPMSQFSPSLKLVQ